jgi:hypothetical protein
MDCWEQVDQFLQVKVLNARKLEHEPHIRFRLRFTNALWAIPPPKTPDKGFGTEIYIDACDSQSSFFLKRMFIDIMKSAFLASLEIEKFLYTLKKKYGIRVLEKQLKAKLLDYFKLVVLEDSIWCRECECSREERRCLYFRRAADPWHFRKAAHQNHFHIVIMSK